MLALATAAGAQEGAQEKAGQAPGGQETAIFAGGCFWCVEADFDKVPGVKETISGFTGGEVRNPTYHQVSAGGTGHKEAVKITYDPSVVSYEKLLDVFWHSVDPTDAGGQFCDRGDSYTTAIFALDDEQLKAAKASKTATEKELGQKIVTEIEGAGEFWPAEAYHQNYYKSDERILSRFGYVTKAYAYKGYREGCGRDQRLKQLWGSESLRGIKQS
ncbi:peptide-methionine (S)-S-oxide reductase [Afifella marina DSM 2698]|nr:peptide-methionine (S)-S-oxide reductase [Afifella marina DSM 2698]MBK1627443.1 peptide-methionine (S)-S-oxide reductase [Afifella marina]MBK5918501.1 peptide-methionine (S)-S-oxide reductase [Afifella marina]RAI20696.1 peptide-methionine (S)-S-oxide reductase [Afifella marina DSM 2698]